MIAEKFVEVLARIMLVWGREWARGIEIANEFVQRVAEGSVADVVKERCCLSLEYQSAPCNWVQRDAFSSRGLIQPIVAKHGGKRDFHVSASSQCMGEPGVGRIGKAKVCKRKLFDVIKSLDQGMEE